MMTPYSFAARRIFWSRVLVVLIVVYVGLSAPPKLPASWLADMAELLGFVLVSLTALGRIWCLVFLGGVKNEVLVTAGPYSVVRNPLYALNFLGAVGLGLVVENPLLALILAILFVALYPSVVRREEAHLAALHGPMFAQYCARTPRWLPDLTLYQEPPSLNVIPAKIGRAILDAMWFLWAFWLWEALEEAREFGFLLPLF